MYRKGFWKFFFIYGSFATKNLKIKRSFTLSLPAQNLPFQQILPTLDFFYLLDCLTITGLDLSGPITLMILVLVSHFNFLFVPCGGLSWLPISFLHIKYTLSYRIVLSNRYHAAYSPLTTVRCSLYVVGQEKRSFR